MSDRVGNEFIHHISQEIPLASGEGYSLNVEPDLCDSTPRLCNRTEAFTASSWLSASVFDIFERMLRTF